MLHRAVREAGSTMVEVRRGDRRVKVSAHAAVLGGLTESAQHGNTRAADMFLRYHQEAEEMERLRSVQAGQGVEVTKMLARLIRTEGAAARENEELRARIIELEGAAARDVVEPEVTEGAAADCDRPPSVALPAAALQARERVTRSAPEVVRVPTSVAHPKKASHPAARRRRDDPLIASKGPVFGGGYGINGGRET